MALAVLLSLTAARSADAAARSVLPPDTVIALPSAPAGAVLPADPRLNDYQLAGRLLGVATGHAAGTHAAGPGQVLWAFGVRWTTTPDGPTGTVGPTLTLQTGTGLQLPVPLPGRGDPPGGGTSPPLWYLSSLPTSAHNVELTVTVDGYAETFDLSAMRRAAPSPAALYRSATTWRTVQTFDTTDDLPTPVREPDVAVADQYAYLAIRLHNATLSWFPPSGPPDVPTDPNQAWLQVELSSTGGTSQADGGGISGLNYGTPMPSTGLTLTIPGQLPITATETVGGGADRRGIGIFTDRYAFLVPTNLTTATLTVTPGQLKAAEDISQAYQFTVTAQGHATFPITFPPPPATTPATPDQHPGILTAAPSTTKTPLGTHHSSAAAPAASGGSGTSGALVIVAILAAVIAAGAGSLFWYRRERRSPVAATSGSASAPNWTPAPPPPGPATTHASATVPPTPPRPVTPTTTPPIPPAEPMSRTASPSSESATADPPPAAQPDPTESTVNRPLVRILGPVEITGWAKKPDRNVVTDVIVYLACHTERPVTTDQLRTALSTGRQTDVTAKTVQTYLTYARTALGASRLPDHDGTGYRLVDVDSDWGRLTEWTRRAGTDTDHAVDLLRRALAEVRGQPFADPRSHAWAHEDGTAAHMTRTVVLLAARLANLATEAGDYRTAAWAIDTAAPLDPLDEPLAVAALDNAAAQHRPDLLARAWREITTSYDRAEISPSSHLVAHHRQLADRLGPAAASQPRASDVPSPPTP